MYSVCKHAFALIYGLLYAGGTSQPEVPPALFLKELSSYPMAFDEKECFGPASITFSNSNDNELYAVRTNSCLRFSHDDSMIWNYYELLEIKDGEYITLKRTLKISDFYQAEYYDNGLLVSGNNIMCKFINQNCVRMNCIHIKNVDRKEDLGYIVMNSEKNRLILANETRLYCVDIAQPEKSFEFEGPKDPAAPILDATISAINFIDSHHLIIASRNTSKVTITLLNLNTRKKTSFLKTPNYEYTYLSAVAANDDFVLACSDNKREIMIWDRHTKTMLEKIPHQRCSHIALHPFKNMCAILEYKHGEGWGNHFITMRLLPQRSLFKKEKMLAVLQHGNHDTQFYFS